jgi:hypothetical protein
MKLDELINAEDTEQITLYIKQFEKSVTSNISISDKSDLTHLLSKCKNALYDIAKKKE